MKVMKGSSQGWKYALLIGGVILMALLVMDFNSRMAELRRLTAEREIVAGRLNNQLQTQAVLKTQIAYATSDNAVADWAYEDGHMVRPGDNPVVPVQSTQMVTIPTPLPAPTQQVMSNWERWLALFLGPRSP